MAYTPYQYQPYGGYSPYPMPQSYLQQPVQAPQQPQTQQGGVSGQPGYLCRPVTSREEAVAVQVEYLSAGTIMPDLGHGMMYLKRFDANTGLSNMFEFALVQPQPNEGRQDAPTAVIPDYTDTFRAFGEQLGSVSDRIDDLAEKLDQLKAKQTTAKGGAKE